jgi:hypothetical protein
MNGEGAIAANGSEAGSAPEATPHEAHAERNGAQVHEPAPIETTTDSE